MNVVSQIVNALSEARHMGYTPGQIRVGYKVHAELSYELKSSYSAYKPSAAGLIIDGVPVVVDISIPPNTVQVQKLYYTA